MRYDLLALRTVGVALFFASAAFLAGPAAAGGLTIVDKCDSAAGSRDDRTRNPAFPAVEANAMQLGVALSACREAYKADGTARTAFQLARALEEGGQRLAAERLYHEAAGRDHTAAMVRYGRLLQRKGAFEEAFAFYRRAAQAGDKLGAYALGMAYRDGIGTAVDVKEAARWLDTASAGGYETASLTRVFPPREAPF